MPVDSTNNIGVVYKDIFLQSMFMDSCKEGLPSS